MKRYFQYFNLMLPSTFKISADESHVALEVISSKINERPINPLHLGFSLKDNNDYNRLFFKLQLLTENYFIMKVQLQMGTNPLVVTGKIKDKMTLIKVILKSASLGKIRLEDIVVSIPNNQELSNEYLTTLGLNNLSEVYRTIDEALTFSGEDKMYLLDYGTMNCLELTKEEYIIKGMHATYLNPYANNLDENGEPYSPYFQIVKTKHKPVNISILQLNEELVKYKDTQYCLSISLTDGTPIYLTGLSSKGVNLAIKNLAEIGLINSSGFKLNFIVNKNDIQSLWAFAEIRKEMNLNLDTLSAELCVINPYDIYTQRNYATTNKHLNSLTEYTLSNLESISNGEQAESVNSLLNLLDSYNFLLTQTPNSYLMHIIDYLDTGQLTSFTNNINKIVLISLLEQLDSIQLDETLKLKVLFIWYSDKVTNEHGLDMEQIIQRVREVSKSTSLTTIEDFIFYSLKERTVDNYNASNAVGELLLYSSMNIFKTKDSALNFSLLLYRELLSSNIPELTVKIPNDTIQYETQISNNPLM